MLEVASQIALREQKMKEEARAELSQLRVQLVATEARLREAEGLLHRILDPANHPPDPWYDVLMEITRFLTPPQDSAKIVEDRKQNKRPPCSEIALRLWTEAGEPPQDSTEAEPEMVCVRREDLVIARDVLRRKNFNSDIDKWDEAERRLTIALGEKP